MCNSVTDFLIQACIEGNLESVKLCVKNGAQINSFDEAPLVEASRNGHLKIVKYLIKHGADVYSGYNKAFRTAYKNKKTEVSFYLFKFIDTLEQVKITKSLLGVDSITF